MPFIGISPANGRNQGCVGSAISNFALMNIRNMRSVDWQVNTKFCCPRNWGQVHTDPPSQSLSCSRSVDRCQDEKTRNMQINTKRDLPTRVGTGS